MNERLDAEEREILEAYKRNQLRSEPGAKEEMEHARRAAILTPPTGRRSPADTRTPRR
jgi:hypothetical protein